MPKLMVDKAKRYVVRQQLHLFNTILVHVHHELHRLVSVEAAGLTPNEAEFVRRRLVALDDVRQGLSKLGTRLQGSL